MNIQPSMIRKTYLWFKIPTPNNPKRKNDHLCYGFIVKILEELSEKAGIKKALNPHAFRHSRATFMARHLKEPEMREYFGWGKDLERSCRKKGLIVYSGNRKSHLILIAEYSHPIACL